VHATAYNISTVIHKHDITVTQLQILLLYFINTFTEVQIEFTHLKLETP